MDRQTFEHESMKYDLMWMDGYRDANWHVLAKAVMRTADAKKHTLVDLGFGKGTAMAFFQSSGFQIEGVDISQYAVERQRFMGRTVYHSSLDDLSFFKDDQFNVGFCNDVLEHMPPSDVEKSLEEMARVCSDYLFVSVCPRPAHNRSKDGVNLHLTVEPKSWWKEELGRFGKVTTLWPYISRSGRYMVELH